MLLEIDLYKRALKIPNLSGTFTFISLNLLLELYLASSLYSKTFHAKFKKKLFI